MVVDKYTQFRTFSIWQPRWHDKTVLLAKNRVGEHNKVIFVDAPSLGTEPYYVSGAVARRSKTSSNGKIDCYAIPLEKLEPLEISERSIHEIS